MKEFFGLTPNGCANVAAIVVAFVIGLCICSLFGSCSSGKKIVQETVKEDSVRIETRIEYFYLPDTVYVEIPAQSAERTSADSVSHLETDYATSDARINADGSLFHSLANKPQKMAVETEMKVERKDSIMYSDKSTNGTQTEIIEVERELSWWQKTQIYGFYVLIFFFLFRYRKNILKAIGLK
jgi:hypothetical protein